MIARLILAAALFLGAVSANAQTVFQNGQPFSAKQLNTLLQTFDTAASLGNTPGTAGLEVQVRGLTSLGDGNGGFFYWNPTDTRTADGVNIIQASGTTIGRWNRLFLAITGITINSTGISGGTSGRLLYDDAGTIGEIPQSTFLLPGNNLSDVANAATALSNLGGAPLASPALTGSPTAPTQTAADNSTKIATDAFVKNQSYAPLASPTFTGTPAAPTPSTADNTTKLATTAYVQNQAYAPLASPALTGTPTAPTQAGTDNTTKLATTAQVQAAISASSLALHVKIIWITSSETWTPDTGLIDADIECWGAGGAGGGVANSSTAGLGGGGGSGGYSLKTATAATIGASQAVTIGAGGLVGTAGNNPGGNGGDTSVGSLCVAKGGTGGSGGAANVAGLGGAGGVTGTGDFTLAGNTGGTGQPNESFADGSNNGAHAPLLDSDTYMGGQGARSVASNGNKAGLAGTAGVVKITERLSQ